MSMENQLTTDMYKRYIELLVLIFHFLEEDIESSTTVLIGWKKCGVYIVPKTWRKVINLTRKMTIRTRSMRRTEMSASVSVQNLLGTKSRRNSVVLYR